MFGRKLKGAFLATAAAGALVLGLGTGSANAAPIASLVQNGANSFSDENREFLIDRNFNGIAQGTPGSNAGQIDIGDSLRGMLSVNTLNSGPANVGGTTSNNEWTAVFQALVTNIVGGLLFFGPDPAFEANIDGGVAGWTGPAHDPVTGALFVFFDDPSNDSTLDFDDPVPPSVAPPADSDGSNLNGPCDDGANAPFVCPSVTSARPPTAGTGATFIGGGPAQGDVSVGPYVTEQDFIETAANTIDRHFWTLGFATPLLATGQPDPLTGEGWTAISLIGGNVYPFFMFTSGATLALGNACVSVLDYGPMAGSTQVNRTTPCFLAGVLGPIGLTDVQLSTTVRGVSDLDTAFEASSEVSGSFNATVVPEPASLSLFGVGLLGLAFAARRRNKKQAA